MPVYKNTDNWRVVKNLKQGEIFMLRDIIKKSTKSGKFDYSHDKDFISSLKPNKDYKEPYIYSYDISDTLLDRGQFAKELEDLLKVANFNMSQSNKYFKHYKFDILGSWTCGKIIVMCQYDLSKDEEKSKGKVVKKFYKQTYKDTKKDIKDFLNL